MASLSDKLVRLKAKELNKLRSKLLPSGVTGFLLKKQGFNKNTYIEIFELVNWYYDFVAFREQTRISVATTDLVFTEAIGIASDLSIRGYCYEINKRDIKPPDGNRPWWEIFATKTGDTYAP
jgi:hypothetical protein